MANRGMISEELMHEHFIMRNALNRIKIEIIDSLISERPISEHLILSEANFALKDTAEKPNIISEVNEKEKEILNKCVEWEKVHRMLDDMNVPNSDNYGYEYSLLGRLKLVMSKKENA